MIKNERNDNLELALELNLMKLIDLTVSSLIKVIYFLYRYVCDI